jgi:tetratricopeptide (TPR) repeat protein
MLPDFAATSDIFMNRDKKKCPECSRQLPVTASNCKYCGAALHEMKTSSLFDSLGKASAEKGKGILSPPRPSGTGFEKKGGKSTRLKSDPPTLPRPSVLPPDEIDEWIPDAGDGSALIHLDQLPVHADGGEADAEETDPAIIRPDSIPSEEQTVVSRVSENKSRQMKENTEVASIFEDSAPQSLPGESLSPADPDSRNEVGVGEPNISDDETRVQATRELRPSSGEPIARPSSASRSTVPPRKASVPPPPRPSVPGRPSIPSMQAAIASAASPTLPRPSTAPPPAPTEAEMGAQSLLGYSAGLRSDIPMSADGIPSVYPPGTPPPVNTSEIGGVDEILYSSPPEAYEDSEVEGGFLDRFLDRFPGSFLEKLLDRIPDRFLDRFLESIPGSYLNKLLDRIPERYLPERKIVVVGIGAFAVTVVFTLIIVWATSGSDTIELVDASAVETRNPASDAANESASASNASAVPSTLAPTAPPSVDTGHDLVAKNCSPLEDYLKKFPWKRHIRAILTHYDTNKLCELFGAAPQGIANALSQMTMVGPTGYDWMADGGSLELYPGGNVGPRNPSLEFLFAGDRLFRIRFKLRNLKIGRYADADHLEKTFKKEGESRDHLGRKTVTFDDGDITVTLIEENWYGQTLRTVEFSSDVMNEELAARIEKMDRLETVFKEAETAYFAWKFDDARKKYEELNAMAPALGAALVKRGLIALRDDDFSTAKALADKCLAVSRQNDVKAEARGLLAIDSLHQGDREGALQHLYEAKKLAPANARFSSYIEQLESGTYSVQSVAQTAARLACIKEGKSRSSEIGVLARGYFPDAGTYEKNLKTVARDSEFKEARDNLMTWECR